LEHDGIDRLVVAASDRRAAERQLRDHGAQLWFRQCGRHRGHAVFGQRTALQPDRSFRVLPVSRSRQNRDTLELLTGDKLSEARAPVSVVVFWPVLQGILIENPEMLLIRVEGNAAVITPAIAQGRFIATYPYIGGLPNRQGAGAINVPW